MGQGCLVAEDLRQVDQVHQPGVYAGHPHQVPAAAIRPAPQRGAEQEEHVLGVARAGDALVTLLDLAAVLSNFTSLTTRETP